MGGPDLQFEHAGSLSLLPSGGEAHARERSRKDHQHGVDGFAARTSSAETGCIQLLQGSGSENDSLACEWADRGLNVNCISPGIVDTPLIWENPALNKLAGTWLKQIPSGRLAQVTDLQAAIVYLASEASSYMVGHNLIIEGGQSLW